MQADTMNPASASVVHSIIERACRAPSYHNTQPWLWRIVGEHEIELYADQRRRLAVGDPTGRGVLISCGAALHHARVVAGALGRRVRVDRFPDGPQPHLLARLHLEPGDPDQAAEETLVAIGERRTDRRRFTSWPVPEQRVQKLADLAAAEGAYAAALVTAAQRFKVELLTSRAQTISARNQALRVEVHTWAHRRKDDGVPTAVLPATPADTSPFPAGRIDDQTRDIDGTDALLVLAGRTDDAASWLATGEGLSALWLAACSGGLSVVPLGTVIEVPETREALKHEVLGSLAIPHLLVRIGWQAISRSELPRTPRRTLEEVLLS